MGLTFLKYSYMVGGYLNGPNQHNDNDTDTTFLVVTARDLWCLRKLVHRVGENVVDHIIVCK